MSYYQSLSYNLCWVIWLKQIFSNNYSQINQQILLASEDSRRKTNDEQDSKDEITMPIKKRTQ